MWTGRFEELELAAVEQDDDARWRVGFPFSPDRPGETRAETAEQTVVYNELDPDTRIGEHRDGADEFLIVLSGTVEVTVGGETASIDGGSFALVPAAASHSVRNAGSSIARTVGVFASAPLSSTFETEPTVDDGT